jgi:hypothetical protein
MARGRERMRDDCVRAYRLLQTSRRLSLTTLANKLDMSERNARRWVNSYSGCLPLRIEDGIVINTKQTEP